jgi:chromosome condensin MukBEF ATPase and DNA-binding subunit MukB
VSVFFAEGREMGDVAYINPWQARVSELETRLAKEREITKRMVTTYRVQVTRLLEIINRIEYQNDELQENAASMSEKLGQWRSNCNP